MIIPKIGHIFRLAQIIQESCEQCTDQEATSLAKAILEHPYSRWGPKDAPVPVGERLPGPEDCLPWPDKPDEPPWCWKGRFIPGFCGRFYAWEQGSAVWPTDYEGPYTHWRPAHALPLPQGEVQ
jgi:hypothetical protein